MITKTAMALLDPEARRTAPLPSHCCATGCATRRPRHSLHSTHVQLSRSHQRDRPGSAMSLLRAAPVSPSAAAMTRLRVRRDTLPRADGAAPAAADKREPVDTDTEDDDHDVGLDEGGLEGGARRRGRMGAWRVCRRQQLQQQLQQHHRTRHRRQRQQQQHYAGPAAAATTAAEAVLLALVTAGAGELGQMDGGGGVEGEMRSWARRMCVEQLYRFDEQAASRW
ncbi:hypothetical protein Purlil1_10404 [Purpureocillium lilacinum]|uniref:Uncharacterized protein n=1 Tax=Purpureocillium lilacinum TaxID=33203 RepID=A0ABR0BMK1_PURLI|nr:hypothetical protein Purlil1_10404 [Purpureocillium lilacinum]